MKAFEEFYQKHPEILFKQSVHSIGEAYWKAALEQCRKWAFDCEDEGTMDFIDEELYE